ncbi:zf-TFIIB domain containing protein, partial [Streptomyces globisporus]
AYPAAPPAAHAPAWGAGGAGGAC